MEEKKLGRKIERVQGNCYRYPTGSKQIEVNLYQLQGFLTLQQSFLYSSTQLFLSWIWIRIKKPARSGSTLSRTAGSGSAKNECEATAQPVHIRMWIRIMKRK